MKKITLALISFFFTAVLLLGPQKTFARNADTISDWYIRSYNSEITVNTDSSLSITEQIVADCGSLPNKHGIFRSLPTFYQESDSKKVNTPIDLVSITDFEDKSIPYSTSVSKGILTWRIGDSNKVVNGVNNYKINYKVKNAIRFNDANFDEFYWNLLGDFWQIEIDSADIVVKFPPGITRANTKISLYTGTVGQKNQDAKSEWSSFNTLQVISTKDMKIGEGITASVTFPKNIITPYKPTWQEKYSGLVWLIFPLIAFIVCFLIWKKYGRDPQLHKTVIAEYGPPDKMTPLEMDAILNEKKIKSTAISAAIVNLAVKGIIKITEIPKSGLFGSKDFQLDLLEKNYVDKDILTESEKYLVSCLFSDRKNSFDLRELFSKKINTPITNEASSQTKLSELNNAFFRFIPTLTLKVGSEPKVASSYVAKSLNVRNYMYALGAIFLFLSFFIVSLLSTFPNFNPIYPVLSVIVIVIIIFVFASLMPQATIVGAEYKLKIKGFKLYMEKAEKYREEFNEKENIFEKYLPYAIAFGIVGLWAEKMKIIYGEKYFATYHPLWYVGSVDNFNVTSFAASIDNLSDSMAKSVISSPSSSGSGGGGFSGGGGGGGGGGGW